MGRVKTIALGGKRGGHTLVDDDVYEWASRMAWHVSAKGYVEGRKGSGRKAPLVRLHREILGLTRGDGVKIDHLDRDRLNNQRSNLRLATDALNQQNRGSHGKTSRFRGVCWRSAARYQTAPWHAQVTLDRKNHHLGYFADEVSAARAAEAFRRQYMPYALPDPELVKLDNPTEETR